MAITARSAQNLQVQIQSGDHQFLADEPPSSGDDGAGPSPYDYVLAGLAACKIITLQLYARRKEWPLEGVELTLSTEKIHARDCQECESNSDSRIDLIETQIRIQGDLDEEQIARLVEISERCPVQRTLTSETVIRTTRLD